MSKGVAIVACVVAAVLWGVFVHGEVPQSSPASEETVIEIELLEEAAEPQSIPAELTEPLWADSASQEVERILKQRCRVRIRNASIFEILDALESKLGVPFGVDKPTLADEGVALENLPPFSMSSRGLPAMLAIRRILSRSQLDLVIEGGEVMISTPVKCGEQLQLRHYPVADLVTARLWNGIDLQHLELSNLLQSTVEPDSWEEVGGPGSLRYEPTSMSLLIRQTQPVHEEIEGMFRMLRRDRQRLPRLLNAAQGPTLEEIHQAEASDRLARRELAMIEETLTRLEEAGVANPAGGMRGMAFGCFDVADEEADWEVVGGPGTAREFRAEIGCHLAPLPANFAAGPGSEARRLALRAMHLALRIEGVIVDKDNDKGNNNGVEADVDKP